MRGRFCGFRQVKSLVKTLMVAEHCAQFWIWSTTSNTPRFTKQVAIVAIVVLCWHAGWSPTTACMNLGVFKRLSLRHWIACNYTSLCLLPINSKTILTSYSIDSQNCTLEVVWWVNVVCCHSKKCSSLSISPDVNCDSDGVHLFKWCFQIRQYIVHRAWYDLLYSSPVDNTMYENEYVSWTGLPTEDPPNVIKTTGHRQRFMQICTKCEPSKKLWQQMFLISHYMKLHSFIAVKDYM
jgi:hypothetical protein